MHKKQRPKPYTHFLEITFHFSLLSLLFFSSPLFTKFRVSLGSELPWNTKKFKGSKCVLRQNKSASTLRDHAKVIREVYPWAGKPFGEAWSFKTWSEGAHITVHSSPLHAQTVKKIRIFVAQIVAQPLDVSIPHFRRCIHLIFMLEFWSWDLEKLQQYQMETQT